MDFPSRLLKLKQLTPYPCYFAVLINIFTVTQIYSLIVISSKKLFAFFISAHSFIQKSRIKRVPPPLPSLFFLYVYFIV